MVDIELDGELSVGIEPGTERLCRLSVTHEGTELVSYESSSDPRKIAGTIALRNVISRHVPGYEKAELETLLETELGRNEAAITRVLERE